MCFNATTWVQMFVEMGELIRTVLFENVTTKEGLVDLLPGGRWFKLLPVPLFLHCSRSCVGDPLSGKQLFVANTVATESSA